MTAFAITLLLGSGVAFGAKAEHSHATSASASRQGDRAPLATQMPAVSPSASSTRHAKASRSSRPSPHASPSATKTHSPKATPTTSKTAKPSSSAPAGQIIKAYLTGYSYFDNTPPGSVDISNPVVHQTAGGTGTYDDPITVAVGHSETGGHDILDWKAGTRFYVPNLHRYFVAEDTCGDGSDPQSGPCHVGYPASATTWLDLWIGGKGGTTAGSNACMDSITGVWSVVINPASDLATDAGGIYGPSGCTKQYGNAVAKS